MLKSGMIIGERYEIISRIGTGGMADVYKARDNKLNRFVAVKVMKSEFREDKTFITKFRREAQAAAGLANPNIVNVFDVGEDNGVYFIVMELVEGITLKEYIGKKGRLSVREATSIAIQVCMGLEAAHAQNIVHRDVKPQNIIISTDGKVKVTDFGIARAASSNTISSNAMGSVHYSSPEQVRGGYADSKSDIYSVGITIYEMLTGRVPFDGDTTVAIAIKHLQDEMEAPSKFAPDLPRSLEQIIFKCTQKSPDRRYTSMTEVIVDLKRSLIEPNGDFVVVAPLSNHARTVVISGSEMAAIKAGRQVQRQETPVDDQPKYTNNHDSYTSTAAARKGYEEPDDDYDDDDDDGDISSKLEKAMTIGGFIIGALIICILIFFIAQAAGLIKFGPKDKEEQITPTPTVTATPVVEEDNTTEVPVIVGLTPESAQLAANEANLGITKIGEEPSAEYPAGTIIRQEPEAGTPVEKNSTINYIISTGSNTFTIPEVLNITLSEAQQKLNDAGITKIETQTQNNADVAVGNVISVTPGVGSSVTADDTVTLVVSTGTGSEEKVTVPSVVGYSKEEAASILEGKGLVVSYDKGHTDNLNINDVMKQSVKAETEVTVGTEVVLTINVDEDELNNSDSEDNSSDNDSEETGGNTTEEQTASTPETAAGGWVCTERVGAPSNYTGGNVKLVLEQTVDGTKQSTTILEDQAITFPYSLNITGAEGVSSGKVYMYELVSGTYKLRCNWPITFTQS